MNALSRFAFGRRLNRNVGLSLAAQVLPLPVAALAIPRLLDGMGLERFGFMTLAWMIIGYFGLFDFGLGRALTQMVARRIGGRDAAEIPALAATGLRLMTGLSLAASLLLLGLAPWLTGEALQLPTELRAEARLSLVPLALALPFVIHSTGLRGLLEACQRFDLLAAVRVPMGVFSYLAPLAVLPFSCSLVPVLAVLAAGRMLTWLVLWLCWRRIVSGMPGPRGFDRRLARGLCRFGGWMTVSNLVAPLMMALDRFVIGAMVSMAAVAWYTTPYEVLSKFSVVPSAIMAVLFPAFSRHLRDDPAEARRLYHRALAVIALAVGAPVVLAIALAEPVLGWWLGSEFAAHSAPVARWLAVGILVHALVQPSFHLIQSAGRPGLTAAVHLAEACVYFPLLFVLISRAGIGGAAAAWCLRVCLSFCLLTPLAHRLIARRIPSPAPTVPALA